MHKSDECVWGNIGNLEEAELCPTTTPETPQMMNTRAELNAL